MKNELKRWKLKTSGNKSELQNHLRATVLLEIEHREGEESEEEGETDNDDCDKKFHVRMNAIDRHKHLLTFRDVEESMSIFIGDNETNIRGWLQEFEEIAELCN